MYSNPTSQETYDQIVTKLDKNDFIDAVLYLLSAGIITATILTAPNAIQMLDKPLNKFFDGLDDRQKKRKLSKLRSYLKTRGLVQGDYEHGITLTRKAKDRVKRLELDNIQITPQPNWDGKWRIIMFDIPEEYSEQRRQLTSKIKVLGLQLLQRSIWVHPYPFREEITSISGYLDISKWITYIEIDHIDNQDALIKRFPGLC